MVHLPNGDFLKRHLSIPLGGIMKMGTEYTACFCNCTPIAPETGEATLLVARGNRETPRGKGAKLKC